MAGMHEFHTVSEELEELEKQEEIQEEEKREQHQITGDSENLHTHSQALEDNEEKIFYFIRHGTTETNELLAGVVWGDTSFKEPQIMTDTRLSNKGLTKAIEVHHQLASDPVICKELALIEIIIASPLTRTLQTTQHVFYHSRPLLSTGVKKHVDPLLRERLYMTSDVGRLKHELESEYPEWDFSSLPEKEEWWYQHDDESHPPYEEWRVGKYYCKGEPAPIFFDRMRELKKSLLQRPEKKILVVAHWGVFHALTGLHFDNCQLRRFTSSELSSLDITMEH